MKLRLLVGIRLVCFSQAIIESYSWHNELDIHACQALGIHIPRRFNHPKKKFAQASTSITLQTPSTKNTPSTSSTYLAHNRPIILQLIKPPPFIPQYSPPPPKNSTAATQQPIMVQLEEVEDAELDRAQPGPVGDDYDSDDFVDTGMWKS